MEKRGNKRRRRVVNYAKLNDGLLEFDGTHPHISFFAPHRPSPQPEAPDLATFFHSSSPTPLRIARDHFPVMGMSIDPTKFTFGAIADILGAEYRIPVINSSTQQPEPGWTLGKWRDYLLNADQQKDPYSGIGALNSISLEFSNTPLSHFIERPKLVRAHDLVDQIWPPVVTGASDGPVESPYGHKPKVRLYSLTGAAHSYTDFHIDFAGSSVFYHVVQGQKSFMFIAPTPHNLRVYEKWCNSSEQATTWFPSLLRSAADTVHQIDLEVGDSLLIPSGWIHAVYTPETASVVGGNFLTAKDMEMQINIHKLEQRTKVPAKFQFPKFNTVIKLHARNLQREKNLDIDIEGKPTIRSL